MLSALPPPLCRPTYPPRRSLYPHTILYRPARYSSGATPVSLLASPHGRAAASITASVMSACPRLSKGLGLRPVRSLRQPSCPSPACPRRFRRAISPPLPGFRMPVCQTVATVRPTAIKSVAEKTSQTAVRLMVKPFRQVMKAAALMRATNAMKAAYIAFWDVMTPNSAGGAWNVLTGRLCASGWQAEFPSCATQAGTPSTGTLCRGADLRPARFRPLSALRGAGGRFCGPEARFAAPAASGRRFPAGSGPSPWTWPAGSSRSSSAAGPREPWARTSRTSTTPKASSTMASPSTAEQGTGQPRHGTASRTSKTPPKPGG